MKRNLNLNTTGAFDDLVQALQALPTVGPKTAIRMASHLLQHDRNAANNLANTLLNALNQLRNCCLCNGFTDLIEIAHPVCAVCSNPDRDTHTLCVVDSIADQYAIEQSLGYTGLYFLLMGRLSPLDGMGVPHISLKQLISRASEPQVNEVILANRFSADGEATAYVIAKHIKLLGKKVTRLSKGIPIGIELEYVDLPTIAHALHNRK